MPAGVMLEERTESVVAPAKRVDRGLARWAVGSYLIVTAALAAMRARASSDD
jgi:hypothetical protein